MSETKANTWVHKIKCMNCSLHFTVYSFEKDWLPNACPECESGPRDRWLPALEGRIRQANLRVRAWRNTAQRLDEKPLTQQWGAFFMLSRLTILSGRESQSGGALPPGRRRVRSLGPVSPSHQRSLAAGSSNGSRSAFTPRSPLPALSGTGRVSLGLESVPLAQS